MINPPNLPGHPNADTGPHLHYTQDGRSGTICYSSAEASFELWYEFALPPALVDIGIPEPQFWEARTKTPLAQRTPILQFVGEQIINDQLTGDGYFLSNDNIMTIYTGRKPNHI